MPLNTAAGLGLFLLGSFALLYATTRFASVQYYTGGIVIALFISGLFYAFGNAIRQGNKVAKGESSTSQPENSEQKVHH